MPFLSANTDFTGEPCCRRCATTGGSRLGRGREGQPADRHHRRLAARDADDLVARNVRFNTDVAGIVNAEAQRLTDAGVNKIILSSHLQDTANERAVVDKLKNVDIVISGGADDLLANPGDSLVPVPNSPGRSARTRWSSGQHRQQRPDGHDPGRVPLPRPPHGHVRRRPASSSRPTRRSPARSASPPTRRSRDYVAEDATLKARITDPLVAYKAKLAANKIGTSEVLLNGGNPNPIRQRESNLGDLVADGFLAAVNRTAAADGRPWPVAFSNGGGIRTSIAAGDITEKSTFDVLPFDNVLVTVPNVTPARFKELMEWGVAALPGGQRHVPADRGLQDDRRHHQPAQVQDAAHGHHAGPARSRRSRSTTARRSSRTARGRRRADRQPGHDELHGRQRRQLPVTGLPARRRGRAVPAVAVRLHRQGPGRRRDRVALPGQRHGRITITP